MDGAIYFLRFLFVLLMLATGRKRKSTAARTKSLAVFLGSGGHTSEALSLISALDFTRYQPRTYIISEGDTLSSRKAQELEYSKGGQDSSYSIIVIPRARRVHQSFLTTPFTALLSLWTCLHHITFTSALLRRAFADVLLLNGPGTCCMLAAAVYVNKFLNLPFPAMIYVESFARVNSLSLSAKILRPLVDRFIVQWPAALKDRRGECHGWLV
ncbi:glycosyltransferase family 1 protein [Fistulina hepatica ATCC 64428]|uniref:UDP-N-acetylglucosamine transferase subunit ALG14 n=1 Tax=Fistulina hepatica ATCC 64428 TaxID=1128425 RepID=A0A0D7A9Y7_9AGAR|nr:glycosyltransferase family 1 protein [Fistulina hepatica ATCC 64428]